MVFDTIDCRHHLFVNGMSFVSIDRRYCCRFFRDAIGFDTISAGCWCHFFGDDMGIGQQDWRQPVNSWSKDSSSTYLIAIFAKVSLGSEAVQDVSKINNLEVDALPPVSICRRHVLNAFDISVYFLVDGFTPYRKICKCKVPLTISFTQHKLGLIICGLFGQTMVTEQMNDVVRAVLIFLSMIGNAVICTGWIRYGPGKGWLKLTAFESRHQFFPASVTLDFQILRLEFEVHMRVQKSAYGKMDVKCTHSTHVKRTRTPMLWKRYSKYLETVSSKVELGWKPIELRKASKYSFMCSNHLLLAPLNVRI